MMRSDILWITRDRLLEMVGGLPVIAGSGQKICEIVVRFREIRMNANGLAEERLAFGPLSFSQRSEPEQILGVGQIRIQADRLLKHLAGSIDVSLLQMRISKIGEDHRIRRLRERGSFAGVDGLRQLAGCR